MSINPSNSDAKPLFEPMFAYCQLDPQEQTSLTFNQHCNISIQDNAFENVVSKTSVISI